MEDKDLEKPEAAEETAVQPENGRALKEEPAWQNRSVGRRGRRIRRRSRRTRLPGPRCGPGRGWADQPAPPCGLGYLISVKYPNDIFTKFFLNFI